MASKALLNSLWPAGATDVAAIDLRRLKEEDFRELKRRVFERALSNGFSRRSAKDVARRLEIKRRIFPRRRFTREALLAAYKDHEILNSLVPSRQKLWLPVRKRRQGRSISCQNFSFIDSPLETIANLQAIVRADCQEYDYRIDFEDEYVLDIGPYLVLGMMRENMTKMAAGGIIFAPTRKVLEAVGLRQFLQMKPFKNVGQDRVWPLPLMRRRIGGVQAGYEATRATSVEIRADQIAGHVDDWLGQLNPAKQLTDYGSSRLRSIVAEILNNAERHGQLKGEGDWIVAGFMARREVRGESGERKDMHVCHLTFLNLGLPISVTIKGAPQSIRQQIDRYCKRHRKSSVSADTLATVFALQDGISRVQQGPEDPSGGTGMMDMVEFANEVGREPSAEFGPEVAIMSGTSYIRFSKPYVEGYGTAQDDRRLQWFNATNDVRAAPDSSHVFDIPFRFPGTLITMRFAMDESLQSNVDSDG